MTRLFVTKYPFVAECFIYFVIGWIGDNNINYTIITDTCMNK